MWGLHQLRSLDECELKLNSWLVATMALKDMAARRIRCHYGFLRWLCRISMDVTKVGPYFDRTDPLAEITAGGGHTMLARVARNSLARNSFGIMQSCQHA